MSEQKILDKVFQELTDKILGELPEGDYFAETFEQVSTVCEENKK